MHRQIADTRVPSRNRTGLITIRTRTHPGGASRQPTPLEGTMTSTSFTRARRWRNPLLAATLLAALGMAQAGGDRFKATGPDTASGGEGDELRTPLQFEDEAANNPRVGSQVLFSRCRRAPFDGSQALYAPLAAPESDAVVGDTTFAFADGSTCFNPQNEQNIVIDPADPRHLVTSSNEYRYNAHVAYVSRDRGASWTNVVLPGWTRDTGGSGVFGLVDSCGDPVLAFSPDGTRLYYAGLVCNFDKSPRQISGVAVAASTDGGLHWAAPVMVGYGASSDFFQDKEWIGVGADGTVHLTWTRFYQGPRGQGYLRSPIVMASSGNGGKSWSSVKEVSDAAHPYNQGSQVGVAPDGTLYVAYEGATPASGYNQSALIVARSVDGGRSFANSEVARVFDDLDCYPIQRPGAQNRQTLSFMQFRINSFPSMAIDRGNGRIAIVWADNEGAGSCGSGGTSFSGITSNQVKLVTSGDGIAWSAPRRITSGAADKVYPSVGANAGRIVVGFYTREYSPLPTPTDRRCGIAELDSASGAVVLPTDPARRDAPVCMDWAVRSSGDDFASQTRMSRESSNPDLLFAGSFIGDYTGTAVDADGRAVTAWTDSRGNPGVTTPNQDAAVGVLD